LGYALSAQHFGFDQRILKNETIFRIRFLNVCAPYLRSLAGGRPAATFFSCLSKKRMQKMATQASHSAAPLASDYPYAGVRHAAPNPCDSSNIGLSLSIFCLAAKASTHMNCQIQKQTQLQNQS
jgi:hypothetical protein